MGAAPTLRVARPVGDLARSRRMYVEGLGLSVLGGFENHAGFDGVMLGVPGTGWHLEFTVCRHHPVAPAPTAEDLLVFYHPVADDWQAACARLLSAGFAEVPAFNPYWNQGGRSFADADGYRTVLYHGLWPPAT
ncbi:VOC family protein [bacterium BD-1]|uniref:VOC family protein n=1 Tax=Arenimonas sp. TaxID=1872635 RepID=UPI0035B03099|nr:VOC family protein [Ottowia caeni]